MDRDFKITNTEVNSISQSRLTERVDEVIRLKELGEIEEFEAELADFASEMVISDEDRREFSVKSPPLSSISSPDRNRTVDALLLGNLVISKNYQPTGGPSGLARRLVYVHYIETGEILHSDYIRDLPEQVEWNQVDLNTFQPILDVVASEAEQTMILQTGLPDDDEIEAYSSFAPGTNEQIAVKAASREDAQQYADRIKDEVQVDPDAESNLSGTGTVTKIFWESNSQRVYAYLIQFGRFVAVFDIDSKLWDDRNFRPSTPNGTSWLTPEYSP